MRRHTVGITNRRQAEEKRRAEEFEYYRARYGARMRIRQLLWGLVIFAAILIISILTTSLREAASR